MRFLCVSFGCALFYYSKRRMIMGFVKMNCPSCGQPIEMDDSREFGFCNYCGTKIMIDKMIVEHKGSVRIDISENIKNDIQNARRAKEKENWEDTVKYYSLVEQNDPSNIEAIFYSSYGKAKLSLISSDIYKRESDFNVLKNCISLIDDNFDFSQEEEQKAIIESIGNDLLKMYESNYVYNQRKNGYGIVVSSDKTKTISLFNELEKQYITALENIAKKIPENEKEKRIYYYELALKHVEWLLANGNLANPSGWRNVALIYHKNINMIDPSHHVPEDEINKSIKKDKIIKILFGSH